MAEVTEIKFNQKQYDMLLQCAKTKNMSEWNKWRKAHPQAHIHLAGADLEEVDLEKVDLTGADLRGANLQSSNLKGANLRKANLKGVMFFEANLSEVDLQGAYLWGADLSGVNLEGANFFRTNLTKADLRGAKVKGIQFESEAALKMLAHPLSEKQLALIDLRGEYTKQAQPPGYTDGPQNGGGNVQNAGATVRTILFDPENIEAGISILNYFGEILRQKFENAKVKVIVEREGLNVRLTIIAYNGEKGKIEKTLEDYIAVVTRRKQISEFLPKPIAKLALKQKLELIHLELRHSNELHAIGSRNGNNRDAHIKYSVSRLYHLLLKNICTG